MTLTFFAGLLALCFGIPWLVRSHREDIWQARYRFWLTIIAVAGRRAGAMVDEERARRQAALAGDDLLAEIEARWLAR